VTGTKESALHDQLSREHKILHLVLTLESESKRETMAYSLLRQKTQSRSNFQSNIFKNSFDFFLKKEQNYRFSKGLMKSFVKMTS